MSFNKVTGAQLSLSICSKRTALPSPLPSAVFQRFMLWWTGSREALEFRSPFSEWSVGLKPRALVKGVNDAQLCPLTSPTLKMLQSRHIIFQISMTLSFQSKRMKDFFSETPIEEDMVSPSTNYVLTLIKVQWSPSDDKP